MKIENWNGHEIRFVEKDGEWWGLAIDIVKALNLTNTTKALLRVNAQDKALTLIQGLNRGNEPVNIVSEFGIYELVITCRKKEAKEFKRWVFDIIKSLRQSTGLEGFEIFRMLDKEHQREAMKKLNESLKKPTRKDFIKANTIANKAVSNMYGYPKMIKKDEMTPEMLKDREPILTDTVDLTVIKNKFNLGLSVSDTVYSSVLDKEKTTA